MTDRDSGRCNVALVISNLEFGGAQRQLIELANNLSSNRFKVIVVSLSDYVPLSSKLNDAFVELVIVHKKSQYDISVVPRLAKVFRQRNIEIAHAFLFDAEIATRLACAIGGVSVMIGSERNSDYVIKANQKVAYALTRGMRHLCVANSNAGARFNASVLGYDLDHYKVVYNCVDTNRFSINDRAAAQAYLGIDCGSFVVGMFASIKPQKNHEMLLRALARTPKLRSSVTAIFVGDELHKGAQGTDSYAQAIRSLVAELGLEQNCYFLGNRPDVEKIYPACDITVLPSHFEGLPNVVLESMACGVPTVVSDVSDNAKVVRNGCDGFVVAANDEAEFTDRLLYLIDNPSLVEEMGSNARHRVEKDFSPKAFSHAISEIYSEALRRV